MGKYHAVHFEFSILRMTVYLESGLPMYVLAF
uniref:Uncharacterized protein n=1 Tax=Arundo donax TaxID=35708 RepID=A0A0A9HGE5_ARUDO